jgi:PKD repeat protein
MKLKNFLKHFLFSFLAVTAVFSLANCNREDDETAPTASFSYTVEGLTVTFIYTGSDADDYSWDFGDGENSMDANPVHTYASGGTYTVTLTVENSAGEDTETQEVVVESTPVAEAPELNFGDADGAFYAINSVSVQTAMGFETAISIGSAVAWFVDGGSSFVSVGNVDVENSNITADLEIQTNNAYTYLENNLPSVGFSNQGVEWNIGGGNGHSQISGLANLLPFPTTKKIAENNDEISGSSDYSLTHDGTINNADSTIFAIYGKDDTIMKTVEGTITSVTFTASEMAGLGEGLAILQIASYSIQSQSLGGKKYYMVNESVASKTVTVN